MHLTGNKLLPVVLLAAMFATGGTTVLAHDHEHSHEETAPQQLTLKNGHKWATDDSLRQAMSRIRAEMNASHDTIHEGKMTMQQYRELSGRVNAQISFLVQNCKLDKEADAMLHLVLADIIAGADAMAGQDPDKAHLGVEKIFHALENYGSYFDHPRWH